MAENTYIAKRDVRIGRKVFRAGQKITGVSEARCEHLRGRFVETADDANARVEAATTDDDDRLEDMTVEELKAFAAEIEVEIPAGSKKADIVALLEAATTDDE